MPKIVDDNGETLHNKVCKVSMNKHINPSPHKIEYSTEVFLTVFNWF